MVESSQTNHTDEFDSLQIILSLIHTELFEAQKRTTNGKNQRKNGAWEQSFTQELNYFITHYENIHRKLNRWVDENFRQLIPSPMTDPDLIKTEVKKIVLGIFVQQLLEPTEWQQFEEAREILRVKNLIKTKILNAV